VEPVLQATRADIHALTEVDWQIYRFKSPLLKLNDIFPEGIQIPAIYPGAADSAPANGQDPWPCRDDRVSEKFVRRVLKEVRHYAHKYMHEVWWTCSTCNVNCTRPSSR
jgi:hypothetical protein